MGYGRLGFQAKFELNLPPRWPGTYNPNPLRRIGVVG